MPLLDLVKQFGIDNVWCTPGQDGELSLKPSKVHAPGPIFGKLNFLNRLIKLPDLTHGWFVYDIGSLYESVSEVPIYQNTWETEQWRSLAEPLSRNNLVTKLFTTSGILFPLFTSYYMYTNEKALLIAIQSNKMIPADLTQQDLYVRFYQNAFYDSPRAAGFNYALITKCRYIRLQSDIDIVNSEIAALTESGGYCFLTINGQRYTNPNRTSVSIGDIVEYIYDPTIDHVESVPVSGLATYFSTMDNKSKRIFHGLTDSYFASINYQDDIEVDILTSLGGNVGFGVNLPLVDYKTIRMLTHRDYGIDSDFLNNVINNIRLLTPSIMPVNAIIEVKFRNSGYDRPVYPNKNLIEDLHTLSSTEFYYALTQNPVMFPEFTADSLESSDYTKLMGIVNLTDITSSLVESAIGYNGLSRFFGSEASVGQQASETRRFYIPELYQRGSNVYGYDENGLYISNSDTTNVSYYEALNALFELVSGTADNSSKAIYGANNLTIDPTWGYRVYLCIVTGGIPQYDWVDITETNQYTFSAITNKISLVSPSSSKYLMVRQDSQFLSRTFSNQFTKNLLKFTLKEIVDRGAGPVEIPLEVSYSDISIFLNNQNLIQGIHYFVDFPDIYITGYKFLLQDVLTTPQSIHVRLVGMGLTVNQFDPIIDKGFIEHGFVGNPNKYISKNDKPLRITIDGALNLNYDVSFSQDNVSTNDINNPLNGLPYEVKRQPVSLNAILNENQELIRRSYNDTDQRLFTYMDFRFVFPSRPAQNYSIDPYRLICPFHCKLIDDILDGTITSTQTAPSQTDAQILATIAPYTYLIDLGPCSLTQGFVGYPNIVIRPHPQSALVVLANTDQLTFLTRASQLATPNAITNIASYFTT